MKRSKKLTIPFNDLRGLTFRNRTNLLKRIRLVIDSGVYLNGSQEKELKGKLSQFLGQGYVATVGSGHDALSLALASLQLNKNDEILFPANVYPTAFPIALSTGKPVLVDCDENGQISIDDLKRKISKKTRVLVLVHLYGLVGQLSQVKSAIDGKNIYLVEDAAQSFGTTFQKKPVGTLGDIGCFSFYPTKNLSALGDGGAVWTKHEKIYEYIQQAKLYGEKKRYQSQFIAGHSRIPEIQAAILNVFFDSLRKQFKKRREVYKYYLNQIQKNHLNNHIRPLQSNKNSQPVVHLLIVVAKRRDQLRVFLKKQGIQTLIHYPSPIHLLPAFAYLGHKKGDFPNAEMLSRTILSLSFYPFIRKKEIDYVIGALLEFYD